MRDLLLEALELPQAERYRLAFLIAENLGYALKNDNEVMGMSEREEIINLIRNEYDPAPSHYRMGEDWDDGAGRIADAIIADKILAFRKELERCRDLRAKLEVQSMKAMDQLRAQIRALGAEPLL